MVRKLKAGNRLLQPGMVEAAPVVAFKDTAFSRERSCLRGEQHIWHMDSSQLHKVGAGSHLPEIFAIDFKCMRISFFFVNCLLVSKYGLRRCISAEKNTKPVFTMSSESCGAHQWQQKRWEMVPQRPPSYVVHCYIRNCCCWVWSEPTGKQTEAGTDITPEHIVTARASLSSPKLPIIPKSLIYYFF